MENIKIGVSAIIENEGKLLLGKRISSHGEGTWGFIGGHLELGETYKDCIIRESYEEAGIEINNIEFTDLTEDFFSPVKHYITIFVKADIIDISKISVKEPNKINEWKWFKKENLPENLFLPINNLIKKGYKF